MPPSTHRSLGDVVRRDAYAVIGIDGDRLRAAPIAEELAELARELVGEAPGVPACSSLLAHGSRLVASVGVTGVDFVVSGVEIGQAHDCFAAIAAVAGVAAPRTVHRDPHDSARHPIPRVRFGADPSAPARAPTQEARMAAPLPPAALSIRVDLGQIRQSLAAPLEITPREADFLLRGATLDGHVDLDRFGRALGQVVVDLDDDERLAAVRERFEDRVRGLSTALAASEGARLRIRSVDDAPPADAAAITAFETALAEPRVTVGPTSVDVTVTFDAHAAPALRAFAALERLELVRRARSARGARSVIALADAIEAAVRSDHAIAPGLARTPARVPTRVPITLADADFGGAWRSLSYRPTGAQFYAYRAEVSADEYRIIAEGDLDGDGTTGLILLDARRIDGAFVRDAVFFDLFLE